MTSEWDRAISSYLGGQRSAIQEALESRSSIAQGQASLVQAKEEEDVGMAGSRFADKLSEEGGKMQADMMTDMSAAGLAPTVFKGAARLATARAGQLTNQWKAVNARRFAEQEGMDADEAAPAGEGTIRGAANDMVDNLRSNVGDAFADAAGRARQVARGVVDQARTAMQRNPMPITEDAGGDAAETRFANPVFDEPQELDALAGEGPISEGARILQMFRSTAGSGQVGDTSFQMGDAINAARSTVPRASAQVAQGEQPGETMNQRQIMEQDPEEGIVGEGNLPTRAPEVPEEAEDDPLDISEVQANTLFQEPKSVVGATDEAQQATAEAAHEAEGIEGEAGQISQDLAPEIGEAANAWSSIGSTLGDAIPFVGFGLGLWGVGQGIADEVQAAKNAASDPFGSVRSEIAAAQGKINNLAANVSTDEFASKLGAGAPSFGSLAARPNMDTSQASSIALHV